MNSVNVLVFGAGGMLGQDLVAQSPQWVFLNAFGKEVDVTKKDVLAKTFKNTFPTFVVNVTAFSHVDAAETQKENATLVNAIAPSLMAELCSEFNIPFIHVSTDYVFSGKKGTPYDETDKPDPIGFYGQSKWEGEILVSKYPKHYILRTSSLYGKGRPNFATRIIEATTKKIPTQVAPDLFCSPTYTGDLAKWIYQLIQKKIEFGTYHLVHNGCCSRFEFAKVLCEQLGETPPYPLNPVPIKELNLPANRPPRSCLSTSKWEKQMGVLPTWKEGIKHFLAEAYHGSIGSTRK